MSNTTITDIIKPELPTIEALLLLNNNEQGTIQTMALQELNYLEQHATRLPAIMECVPSSIVLAVKNVLRKNLSLDPNAGLVYIKTRNQNIAPYGQPNKWIKVLEIQETANGKISYNRQIGRLLDYTKPLPAKDANGKVIGVSMKVLVPSWPQPRWEEHEYDESDFRRWQAYSHKENAKGYDPKNTRGKEAPDLEKLNYANALYTSFKGGIDPEFARAKCIVHSLKKLGSNPNEIPGRMVPVKQITPIIDPGIAVIEANDSDYTYHEEINSHINEEQASHQNKPQQTEGFNPNDL